MRRDVERGAADGGKAIPILPMREVEETRAFYERLGFEFEVYADTPDAEAYAFARRGTLEIHFFGYPDVDAAESDAGCYLRVADADALYDEFRAAGVRDVALLFAPIEDKPWGMREFAVVDPNGNLLRVGHRRR